MTERVSAFLLAALFLVAPGLVSAQTQITFRIDMRPQMEDSTFIPDQHTIELSGNQLPFSRTRTIELKDDAPVDSIYVTKINFPSLTNGKILKYNFLIKAPEGNVTERRPRLLKLEKQKQELEIALFNSFFQ